MRNPLMQILTALLLIMPGITLAGGHVARSQPDESIYGTLMFGWHDWSDAGDIQADPAFLGDDFDSGGFDLELSIHTRFPGNRSGRLMWGVTTGVMGNESNLRGLYEFEELTLSMIYVTPSMKFKLLDGERQRIFLDFGAGYYAASIDEYEDRCYYYCSSTEYWDDSSFGGFIGISADFDLGQPGGSYLNVGIKAHDVDFSAPIEIGSTQNLGGPIVQFQVGMGFGNYW